MASNEMGAKQSYLLFHIPAKQVITISRPRAGGRAQSEVVSVMRCATKAGNHEYR